MFAYYLFDIKGSWQYVSDRTGGDIIKKKKYLYLLLCVQWFMGWIRTWCFDIFRNLDVQSSPKSFQNVSLLVAIFYFSSSTVLILHFYFFFNTRSKRFHWLLLSKRNNCCKYEQPINGTCNTCYVNTMCVLRQCCLETVWQGYYFYTFIV